jgi:hypothetical protein
MLCWSITPPDDSGPVAVPASTTRSGLVGIGYVNLGSVAFSVYTSATIPPGSSILVDEVVYQIYYYTLYVLFVATPVGWIFDSSHGTRLRG